MPWIHDWPVGVLFSFAGDTLLQDVKLLLSLIVGVPPQKKTWKTCRCCSSQDILCFILYAYAACICIYTCLKQHTLSQNNVFPKHSPAQTSSSSNYIPVPSIKEHDYKKQMFYRYWCNQPYNFPYNKKHASSCCPKVSPRHWKHVGNSPLLQQNVSDSSMEGFWGLQGGRFSLMSIEKWH